MFFMATTKAKKIYKVKKNSWYHVFMATTKAFMINFLKLFTLAL